MRHTPVSYLIGIVRRISLMELQDALRITPNQRYTWDNPDIAPIITVETEDNIINVRIKSVSMDKHDKIYITAQPVNMRVTLAWNIEDVPGDHLQYIIEALPPFNHSVARKGCTEPIEDLYNRLLSYL